MPLAQGLTVTGFECCEYTFNKFRCETSSWSFLHFFLRVCACCTLNLQDYPVLAVRIADLLQGAGGKTESARIKCALICTSSFPFFFRFFLSSVPCFRT
jgi:hypothetical protein